MFKINKNSDFSKENQKKYRALYEKAVSEIWKGDKKMIDYEMKNVYLLVPIEDGKYLIPINKINLEKDFYFGYSDIGQGISFNDNVKRMDEVKKRLGEYFIEHNTAGIDAEIKKIQEVLEDKTNRYVATHYVSYYAAPKNCIVHSFGFIDKFKSELPITSSKYFYLREYDLNKLLLAYSLFKEATIERLNSYLKKYGTSKLHVSSYWIDR